MLCPIRATSCFQENLVSWFLIHRLPPLLLAKNLGINVTGFIGLSFNPTNSFNAPNETVVITLIYLYIIYLVFVSFYLQLVL